MRMRMGMLQVWVVAVLMVIGMVSRGISWGCTSCECCAAPVAAPGADIAFAASTESDAGCANNCCGSRTEAPTPDQNSDAPDQAPSQNDGCQGGCTCPMGCCTGP